MGPGRTAGIPGTFDLYQAPPARFTMPVLALLRSEQSPAHRGLIMFTRAQLHRRRSHLSRAWDLHVPAMSDKQPTSGARMGVRTEIAASWARSAAHIMPEAHEAPL